MLYEIVPGMDKIRGIRIFYLFVRFFFLREHVVICLHAFIFSALTIDGTRKQQY